MADSISKAADNAGSSFSAGVKREHDTLPVDAATSNQAWFIRLFKWSRK